MTMTDIEADDKNLHARKLLHKVDSVDLEKCWPVRGRLDKDGYAYIQIQGVSWRAHRLAHVLWNGPIPEGLVVDHRCWVRNCVNPRHLRVLTVDENLAWDARKVYLGPAKPPKTKIAAALRNQAGECRKGHNLAEVGLVTKNGRNGKPTCRMCQMVTQAKHREANGLPAVLTGRINGKRDPNLPKSGVKGISWNSKAGKWFVAVYFLGKNHYSGTHAELSDAVTALKELHERLGYPEEKRIYV